MIRLRRLHEHRRNTSFLFKIPRKQQSKHEESHLSWQKQMRKPPKIQSSKRSHQILSYLNLDERRNSTNKHNMRNPAHESKDAENENWHATNKRKIVFETEFSAHFQAYGFKLKCAHSQSWTLITTHPLFRSQHRRSFNHIMLVRFVVLFADFNLVGNFKCCNPNDWRHWALFYHTI